LGYRKGSLIRTSHNNLNQSGSNQCYLGQSTPDQQGEICQRLKLLSYNFQVGINSSRYRDYLTQSWRHILPDSERTINLHNAANWLSDYDIVALQEVDAGSIRSDFINQVEFLAQRGGFAHYHQQQNRRIGTFAAHANGLLSKLASTHVIHHKLPSRIPGRGALQVNFESGGHQIVVLSVHLSLGKRARELQLQYIAEIIQQHRYFIIMGDMNCPANTVSNSLSKMGIAVQPATAEHATYPRWKPKHCYDQIWVSRSLNVINMEVLNLGVSDHLPVSMEIEVPLDPVSETIPNRHLN